MEVKFPNYVGTIFKFNFEKSTWDFLCKAEGVINILDGKFGLALRKPKTENLDWAKDIPSNIFQYLDLSYQNINDELLLNFNHFNSLEVLSINNNPITSKGLSTIIHNTKIKRLQISNTLLEEKDISLIKNLKELTSLEMRFDKDFTGSFLKDLENLKNIEYLFIQCKKFLSDNLMYLSNFSKLKTLILDLKSTRIDDSSLKSLENTKLESLTLNNMYIHGVGFTPIPRIKSLKELNLNLVKLNHDVDLNPLSNLNLEKLSINFIDIGTLKEIQNIKSLKKLSCIDTMINDEELKYLMNLPNLETLHIGMNEFITKKGIRYIENHPSLKSVDISSGNIEDINGLHTNFKLYI